MNTSIDNRIVTVIRWVGRILSVLLLAIVAAFTVGEEIPRPLAISPRELALCAAFLTMLVGLVAGWRWEGLGGLLVVGGFAAFAIVNGGLRLNPLVNPLWMFLLAGLMFLFCWWRTPSVRDPHESRIIWFWKAWFYRIMLPAIWLTTALFSWNHPGDEYGLFLISCLPAVWIAPFLHFYQHSHLREVLSILLVAGVISMALAGWLMDTLRIWRSLWLPLFVLGAIGLTWYGLSQYPTYARAMAKNGSLTAYVSAATNMSLYLSVIVGVPVALLSDLVELPDN